jgi:hypothetical protein
MKKLGVGEMGTWISARIRPIHRRAWDELQWGRTAAMSEHDERADELEHEAEEMQERADRLEHDIGGVRDDWTRKKNDPSVPGAVGDDDDADDDEPPPETSYPSKGDED